MGDVRWEGAHVSPPRISFLSPWAHTIPYPTPTSQLGRNRLNSKGRCLLQANNLHVSWPTVLQMICLWKATKFTWSSPQTLWVLVWSILSIFLTLFKEAQRFSHSSGPTGSTCWEHRQMWHCLIQGLDPKWACWVYLLVPMDGIWVIWQFFVII